MDELAAHVEYVGQHPDDKTAALSLADHHEEVYGTGRLIALKVVARVRKAARDARQMAVAAAFIRPDAPNSASIRALVVMASEVDDESLATIYLKPGRHRPKATACDWHGDGGHYPYWTITVGALWVLACARGIGSYDPNAGVPAWLDTAHDDAE